MRFCGLLFVAGSLFAVRCFFVMMGGEKGVCVWRLFVGNDMLYVCVCVGREMNGRKC